MPPPQHPPAAPPPTEPLCARTRAAVVAATPLQKLYGVPDPSAWGPDEANVPDDPQPSSPDACALARAHLEQWRHSSEAAHATIIAEHLEYLYTCLDCEPCLRKEKLELEVRVMNVRYEHALRKLQAVFPAAVPEVILEPQLANMSEIACRACPYGFGRLVRVPWALHVPSLGFCSDLCLCDVRTPARKEICDASGVGWIKYQMMH